jgi:hypothetical protein
MPRNRTAKSKLEELFPTAESLTTARLKHSSWAEMSRAIGISNQSLYDYRECLDMTGINNGIKPKSYCFDTVKTTNELIRELIKGESKNVVTKYKIVDLELFRQNQRGYEGLELIGTEQGTTWSQVSSQMPHAVSR